MKRSKMFRVLLPFVVVGLVTALAAAAFALDIPIFDEPTTTADSTEAAPEAPKNPKLEATDLNDGTEPGTWSDILPKGAAKNVPTMSDFGFASVMCGLAVTPPATPDDDFVTAFRRKDPAGAGAAKGQSKLLAQRILRYKNDEGEGGVTGQVKATLVLDYFRALVNTPNCTWTTEDPGSDPANPRLATWTVTVEPDPYNDPSDSVGDGPGNSLHFRVTRSLAAAGSGQTVDIVNDVIFVKRGRTLNMVMLTSSNEASPEEATANKGEAKAKGKKADKKLNDNNGTA